MEIGFREDGLMWVSAGTASLTATSAEQYLGHGWEVIDEVWIRSTGEAANSKGEEYWEVCSSDSRHARPGWLLVDTCADTIFRDGSDFLNPHRGGVADRAASLTKQPITIEDPGVMSLEDFARLDPEG